MTAGRDQARRQARDPYRPVYSVVLAVSPQMRERYPTRRCPWTKPSSAAPGKQKPARQPPTRPATSFQMASRSGRSCPAPSRPLAGPAPQSGTS